MDIKKQLQEKYRRLKKYIRGHDRIVNIGKDGAGDLFGLWFPVPFVATFLKACLLVFNNWKEFPLPDKLELPTGGLTHLPLDASGTKGCAVSESEINIIVEYGLKAFGEHDIDAATRQIMVKRFATACPTAFRFLGIEKTASSNTEPISRSQGDLAIDRQQKVGYTCVLPLRKNGYTAYRRGELSDYHFNKHHFTSPRNRQTLYLCIQAFALCVMRVNRIHAQLLLEGIAYHISLYVDNILTRRPVLIAEAATPSGQRILERFAFAMIGESANSVSLYELDTRDYERMPQRSRDTVRLLDAMVKQFAEKRALEAQGEQYRSVNRREKKIRRGAP